MAAKSKQRSTRSRRAAAPIVDLSSVREVRRRELADGRVRKAIEDNRAALTRLFQTGLIFTQQGARAARTLLLAHQALLKVVDLFARLGEDIEHLDLALRDRGEEVFAHLDAQLHRAAQLTARTGEFLSGRLRE